MIGGKSIKKNVVNEIKTNVGALENRLKRIETERNDLLMSTRKLQEENKSLKSAKASLQAKNEHFDNEVRELSQDSFQIHSQNFYWRIHFWFGEEFEN